MNEPNCATNNSAITAGSNANRSETNSMLMMTFIGLLVAGLWQLILNYPYYTFGIPVLCVVGAMFFKQRRERIAKIKSLRDVVLKHTLDRLSVCDHEGWAVLMLRDEVASFMCPTNYTERQFIIDYVWPSIYALIQADNRVRKFRKMVHGRQLEHWGFDVLYKKMRNSTPLTVGATQMAIMQGTVGVLQQDVGDVSKTIKKVVRTLNRNDMKCK